MYVGLEWVDVHIGVYLVCVEVRIRVVELETVDIPLVSGSVLFYHSLDLETCLCKQSVDCCSSHTCT